jgi:hypothetical protein
LNLLNIPYITDSLKTISLGADCCCAQYEVSDGMPQRNPPTPPPNPDFCVGITTHFCLCFRRPGLGADAAALHASRRVLPHVATSHLEAFRTTRPYIHGCAIC